MCETKRALTTRKKRDEIPGYEVIERNAKQGKEGIILAAKEGTFKELEEVTQSELRSILTVRIKYKLETVRVITLHAPQESETADDRADFFNEVAVQVERCKTAGDKLILLGDFNARLSQHGDEIIPASPNGKLLHELLEDHDLKVGNFSSNTSGEWTRIQYMKNGTVNKSRIDYVLLEDDLMSLMNEMTIDEDKIFCPYRVWNTKREKKIIFSDHCAILISLQITAGAIDNIIKSTHKTWNYSEDGYSSYKDESAKPLDVEWDTDSTTTYDNWTIQFESLLHSCFSKRTVKTGNIRKTCKTNKCVRNILSNIAKGGKIQRRIIRIYLQRLLEIESRQEALSRADRLKRTMAALTEEERFSPNGYWRMKKAADKNLRMETTYTVIKENGVEVSGPKAINQAYKDEFQHRLRTREPHDGWSDYVDEINKAIREWLESESDSSPPFTMEELDKVIAKLKKGKRPGLDDYPSELFIHAGGGVRESLLQLLNQVKASHKIPEQWNIMKIVTIYKNKGSKKMLRYYRGIFLAIVISKIFESLIKLRIDPDLQKINVLQAGSRFNRSGADNVFLLRGCADHYKATKQPLYITSYDYEQAFDSLWVEKCILSLKNLGVSKEMLQLIYNMNKKAKVIVKTPYGMTTAFETDPIVKQGTVLGAALCSSSTGEYCGVNKGVPIGSMMLSSLLYVDDVIDITTTLSQRQEAHKQAVIFTKQNNLSLSGTKCYGMAMNTDDPPPKLMIDDVKKVIPAEVIVYLGDLFNEKGNNDDLIKDRVRRGTKASISITSLMQEINLGTHEISVWLLLYRALFLATVLFNSQTWSCLRQKDLDKLKVMQQKFLKKIVRVSSGTPNSFIFLELGVLPIEAEIHKRQLMYLHRILSLPKDDPVAQMLLNLILLDEKGETNWWTQVKTLLPKYGLPSDLEDLKKNTFKCMVNKAINKVVLDELVKDCSALKKTTGIEYKALQMQEYLSIMYPKQARLIFRSRCKTLDIKTHNTYKYNDDTVCRKCDSHEETLEHVINCGFEECDHLSIDTQDLRKMSDTLYSTITQVANRIESFYDDVSRDTPGIMVKEPSTELSVKH